MSTYTTTGPRTQKAARQLVARTVAAWLAGKDLDELFDGRSMTDVQWKRLEDAVTDLGEHLQKRAGKT